MTQLEADNAMMQGRMTQLEEELKIVNWYLETMENGVDTKKMVQAYAKLKRAYKSLVEKSKAQIKMLERELESARS